MSRLAEALVRVLGEDNVATDAASCALAASDLFDWPGAARAELVIRPASTGETASALRLIAETGRDVIEIHADDPTARAYCWDQPEPGRWRR